MGDKIKVIVADDEESHIELIRRHFISYNDIELYTTDNLTELLVKVEEVKPNIILSDFKYPDGDARLLLNQYSANIPIIIMTSYGNESLAVELIKAGALDYLVKSTDTFGNLRRSIDRALREWTIILENRQSHNEIIAKNIEIEKQNEEFRLLNNQLILAKEMAEESDRLKSAFLANMSHEIRTPMNGIIGFSDLLENVDIQEVQRKNYIQIIKSSAQHLLSIINDIVDISKIETGNVKIASNTVKVSNIIRELYSFFKPISDSKSIQLSVDIRLPGMDFTLLTDEVKLKQIITNLVNNAIKFTDSGRVVLGVNHKDCFLEFFIEDTGIGIPQQFHEVIFERFRQADYNISGKHGGTGLGLAITKAYVEMLGGKIWVESEIGKGSTFYFTLPIQNVDADKTRLYLKKNDLFKPDCFKNKTVLIAEDEVVNFMYANELILKTGATVLKAENGQRVLEIMNNGTPIDLILMDIKMPVMDGFEATQAIRKSGRKTPIVAVTAFALSDEKQKAIEVGCNAFLHKPFQADELYRLLWKFI